MAENAGGISYTVEINTVEAINAEKQLTAASNKVENSLRGVENAAKGATDNVVQFGKQASAIKTQVTGTAQAVNRGLNQALTNTSYQIQDIAVQLAGGQNPFLVMAQQIPQLLVGFGAVAAGAGAAVAVLGGLSMALFSTSTNAEKMQSAIDAMKATLTLSAAGVVSYTEKMQELADVSEVIANFELEKAMREANKAIASGIKAIGDEFSKLYDFDPLTDFNDAVRYSDQLSGRFAGRIGEYAKFIGEQLGATGEDARKLGTEFIQTFKQIESAKTQEEVTAIQEKLIQLTTVTGKASEKFIDAFGAANPFFSEIRAGTATIEAYNNGLIETSDATSRASEETRGLIESLVTQNIELNSGERAALLFSMGLSGLSEAQKQLVIDIYDANQAIISQREENDRLLDQFAEFEQWDEKQRQSRERAKGQAEGFATGIINRGMSESERLAADMEKLNELRQQNLLDEQTYIEALNSIKSQQQGDPKEQEQLVDWDSFQGRAADAFAAVATGAKTGKEAMRELGMSIVTEGIASLAKMGIQYGINAMMANTAMATTTATTVASGAAITAAMAPAAAATSVATAGAAPAAAAPIAMSTIGMILAALAVGGLAGAREFGGPVTAGKSYLVGERGPEIFTPGMGGGITSNKDLMSGGGVNVNIYNYGNDNVQVKQNGRDVDIIIKQVIGAVAGQISSGQGQVGKALKSVGVKPSAIGG